MTTEPLLQLDKVSKSFAHNGRKNSGVERLAVLADVSMIVAEGEIIGLLGPSGCGKSTLLNLVAGFEQPDAGTLWFAGKAIEAPAPERSVVFQTAVLFPWLTVKENILYGLRIKKVSKARLEADYSRFAQLVGLEGFDHYYPNQLSGGMQQRAALARALLMKPRMLLMDEPFAALDAQTRMRMQQLLLAIADDVKPTILFVTHDIEEALILADRVVVMGNRPGRIVETITVPFNRPRDLSVIGKPEFAKMKETIRETLFDFY